MDTFYIIALIVLGAILVLLLPKTKKTRHTVSPETVIMPYLYVEQLNPVTLRTHKRYSVNRNRLVSRGATITREGNQGDVVMDCAFPETNTVGFEHAVIALDEYGCFIQNNHGNGMTLEPYGPAVDEVSIKNGTVVYLGEQPIRFTFPTVSKKRRPADVLHTLWSWMGKLRSRRSSRKHRADDESYYQPSSQDDMW